MVQDLKHVNCLVVGCVSQSLSFVHNILGLCINLPLVELKVQQLNQALKNFGVFIYG